MVFGISPTCECCLPCAEEALQDALQAAAQAPPAAEGVDMGWLKRVEYFNAWGAGAGGERGWFGAVALVVTR